MEIAVLTCLFDFLQARGQRRRRRERSRDGRGCFSSTLWARSVLCKERSITDLLHFVALRAKPDVVIDAAQPFFESLGLVQMLVIRRFVEQHHFLIAVFTVSRPSPRGEQMVAQAKTPCRGARSE